MEIFQKCMSWISSLRAQADEDDKSSTYLPYDIIVEIFTRLPADFVVQCRRCKLFRSFTTTSGFVDMHLSRAEPVMYFQHYTYPKCRASEVKLYVDISSSGDMGKNITRKHFKIKKSFASGKKGTMPLTKGSYRGLVVFRNVYDDTVLLIQNPVTQSQAVVVAPSLARNLRGFYFHPASGEYRLLCGCLEGGCLKFTILSLKTQSSRRISNPSHAPSGQKLPTVFNGALHWIVDDEDCNKVLGESRHCSNAIVIFNMDSEEFCTMPHPGGHCNWRTSHHWRMELMEYDGRLCLCDASSGNRIVIWTLEDYTRRFWLRWHVVIIEPLKLVCTIPAGCSCHLCKSAQAIHIYGDDLLFRMYHNDVFLYNLSSDTFKRVGNKCSDIKKLVCPFVHIDTLVSLHIDDKSIYPHELLIS